MVRTCRGVRIKDVCVTLANNMVHFDDASTTQWVRINSEGRFLFSWHMFIMATREVVEFSKGVYKIRKNQHAKRFFFEF